MLAGLLPALKASAPSLVNDLRGEAPAGKVGRRRFALRDALVVTQVALTAVLLVVAGLLLRSLGASAARRRRIRSARSRRDLARSRHGPLQPGAQRRVLARSPVARARAAGRAVGGTGRARRCRSRSTSASRKCASTAAPIRKDSAARSSRTPPCRRPTCARSACRLVDGRDISETDIAGSPDVVVINQTMAEQFWPKAIRGRPHGAGRESDTLAHVSRRRRRLEPPAARRARDAVADGRTSPTPSESRNTSSSWRGPPAAPTRLLAAMRRELLAIEPSLVFMTSNHDGAEPGHEPDAGARRRDARRRVRRPRHAARRDRPLRRDRVLGGAPHAGNRRAHGDWRQSVRGAVDGDAPGLFDCRDRPRRREPARGRRGGRRCAASSTASRRSIRSRGGWRCRR